MRQHRNCGWFSAKAASLLALAGLMTTGALAQVNSGNYPTNAAEIKLRNPGAQDGLYVIDGDGPGPNPPFVAYCYAMAGSPKEYVELARVGEGTNFSEMAAGGAWVGTNVFTHFSKLRIDPTTLVIQRDDYTFSISRGGVNYPPQPDSLIARQPYVGAGDCIGSGSAQGRGNVDLRETPFALADSVTFQVGGYAPSGTFSISPGRKVVDMQGGGYCGGVSPVGLFSFKFASWTSSLAPQVVDFGPKPDLQTRTNGDSLTLIVAASGQAPLLYQWQHNGTNLASGGRINGATEYQMNLAGLQTGDAGRYSVVVSNSRGAVTSQVVTLSICVDTNPPAIFRQPSAQSTFAGGSVTLDVGITGARPFTYQWRLNGAHLPGETNATLRLTNVRLDQDGNYSVAVSNAVGGVISADASLVVGLVAAWGDDGSGQTSFASGLRNVVALAGGGQHSLLLLADGRVVAGGRTLYGAAVVPAGLSNVVAIAAHDQQCLAVKSDGAVVQWGSYANEWYDVPPVSGPPAGLGNVTAVAAGVMHALARNTDGTVVSWGSSWYDQSSFPTNLRNVVAIAAGGWHSLALQAAGTVIAWKGTYDIPDGSQDHGQANVPPGLSNVVAIAAGYFHSLALTTDGRVVAWGAGTTNSGTAPDLGQSIVPAGLGHVVAIAAGAQHSLAVKADGTVVSWGDNSGRQTEVPFGLTNVVAIAGGAGHSLALVGSSGPFFINPRLTGLEDRAVLIGSSLELRAAVGGATPMTYQWRLNGTNLPNATNAALELAHLQFVDAGAYSVVVSNTCGALTSPNAQISVVPLLLTASPQSLLAWAGGNVTFSVFVQSTLPVTYQWRFNGVDLPGETNAKLRLTSLATNEFGNYSVAVSNAFGAVVSLDAVLTEAFVDLSSGLIAYYPFDGVATDASGRGHDAEPQGGVQYAPGKFGLAVALDGVDDFLSTAASADFAVSRNFTAAFWCKPDPGSSGWILWNGPEGCAWPPLTWMAWWEGSKVTFEKCGFGNYWIVGPDMPGGEWTHVAMVVRDDGDTGYLYVNGVCVGSSGAGEPFAVPSTSFVMGRRGPMSTQYYRGLLDEVRVYSRALSDAEVQALYLYESPPLTTPLLTHQPSNQSVVLGSAVVFSVTAFGADPLGYQWRFNGIDLPGETKATLTLSTVQASQFGNYSVTVSNAYGGVVSSEASLSRTEVVAWGLDSNQQTDLPIDLTSVVSISAGSYHSLALKTDGTVIAWGRRDFGEADVPPGLTNVVAIAAGHLFSMALKSDGGVVAWGAYWDCCHGTPVYVPVGLSNVIALAAGVEHSLALKSDGTVVVWGPNTYGQTNAPPGLINVVAISAGGEHSLVLKGDGTVAAWGKNDCGQTDIPDGLTNVVAIAAGDQHSLALKADGRVLVWGAGAVNSGSYPHFGQSIVPVGLTNAVAIAGGVAHSLALRADGTVEAWGAGLINNGVDPNFGQSIAPFGLTNVLAISTRWDHNLALVGPEPSAASGSGLPFLAIPLVSRTAVVGTTVQFYMTATGARPVTNQWQLNGTNIPNATNQILALANVSSTDAGDYRLIVANAYGSVASAVARLTVVPLNITAQPESQRVWAGDSANFSVQANANSPLSYQWRFDGANIASATNSTLTLANTRLSDAGDYTVVLWNSSGSVTSAVARLTVAPAVPLDHWSSRNSGNSDDLFAITYGNGHFVAVGDRGTILASTNSVNWSDHSVFDGYYLNGVTYGNGLYVAVGGSGGILTSPDAVRWIDRSGEATTADLRDVAYGNGVYVVIGTGGTILISADANTWKTIVPDPNQDLNAITFENGIFVVVGQRSSDNVGLILTSTNGVAWSNASPGTPPNLRGVGAGPGGVVVVGNGGTVMLSTNNSTWTGTTVSCPGGAVNLRACTYGSGSYVVVGNSGTILSSETATNWTCRASGTTANLHSIAFGQGTYVAVGNGGTILQAVASQPRLSVSCSGAHLELRWPSLMTGYVLECASSLSRSAVWSPVTNQVTVAGSDCITTHGMDSPARFYRLRSR